MTIDEAIVSVPESAPKSVGGLIQLSLSMRDLDHRPP